MSGAAFSVLFGRGVCAALAYPFLEAHDLFGLRRNQTQIESPDPKIQLVRRTPLIEQISEFPVLRPEFFQAVFPALELLAEQEDLVLLPDVANARAANNEAKQARLDGGPETTSHRLVFSIA